MTNPGGPDEPFGGVPFGSYPAGQPQPTYGGPPVIPALIPQPPPRRPKKTVLILAAVATVVAISVAALVIWLVVPSSPSTPSAGSTSSTTATPTTSTTPTVSVPQPVGQSQLTGFLLSLDDVKRLANAPNDYKTTDSTALNGSEGITVTPPQCVSALFGGGTEVFDPSAVIATVSRHLDLVGDMKKVGLGGLEQRVVLYENPAVATRLVTDIEAKWRGCAGPVTVAFDDGTPTSHYTVGPVSRGNRNPSIVLVSSTMANSPLFVSTRVVAAKANVVVDLALMGADLGGSAESIALEILSRIPG
jgi:hypothetical protein